MIRLAKEMGLTTVVTPETAPHFFEFPSMMQASISTVPLVVRTDPLPALKCGQFSSSRTYSLPQFCCLTYLMVFEKNT